MKKIGIAVMILAVIGVAVTAGVFITRNPETTKVEQKHEKIKKEGKAYAGKYRMNISLDTKNKVLSGTVRASLKNATDDDLKSICVRNWVAAILQEKTNQKKKACKTEITSARIGGHTLQIDKKEDASVLYLSDKNRVLAPARECVTVEFSFTPRFQNRKTDLAISLMTGMKCISFRFVFPVSLAIKRGRGTKILMWVTTMRRMCMRQQIMKLHSGIRKNTRLQQPARSTLCRMEQRLPAKS